MQKFIHVEKPFVALLSRSAAVTLVMSGSWLARPPGRRPGRAGPGAYVAGAYVALPSGQTDHAQQGLVS